MLKTPRGILATVLLLTLAAGSLVVGWQAWRWWAPLPDLATADREGVLRWLVLVDLASEPLATQRQLLARVEEVFAEEIPGDAVSKLSAAHVEQVRRNAELLKELWFHERVDGYYACPATDRPSYLDRQIATVVRWASLDQVLSQAAAVAAGTPQADDLGLFLVGFFDTLDHWIERAGPSQYDRIRAVVKAGLVRWLATQDLRDTSPSTRHSLVRGLEKQLAGELDFGGVTDGYSPAADATFAANVDLLAEAWFRDKALTFATLSSPQKPKFLDQQVVVVEELTRYADRSRTQPDARKPRSSSARIAQWIAAAPAAEQPALRQFAQQLQAAVLLRRMRTLIEPLWK